MPLTVKDRIEWVIAALSPCIDWSKTGRTVTKELQAAIRLIAKEERERKKVKNNEPL